MSDNFIVPAFLVSAVISLAIAWTSWKRRPAPGASALAVLTAAQFAWSVIYALQWGLTDHDPSMAWLIARTAAIAVQPTALLVLVLEYTGRSRFVRRPVLYLFLIEPVLTLAVELTEPLHHLYLGGDEPSIRVLAGGPWFTVHFLYSYALILISAFLLFAHLGRHKAQRRQTLVLLLATTIPAAHFVLETAGFHLSHAVNAVPLSFTLAGILYFFALFRLGLLRVVPIARDALIEQMSEGIVVFDAERRIVDINPAAMAMTGATGEVLGRVSEDAFPSLIDTIMETRRQLESKSGHSRTVSEFQPGHLVETAAARLYDNAGREIATLVTMRDVTEQQRLEAELEQRQGQLAASLERSGHVLAAMSEGVLLINADCLLLRANPSAGRILGVSLEDRIGESLCELTPSLPAEDLAEAAHSAGESSTAVVELPDGRALTVEATPMRETVAHQRQTLLVIRDDTERRAAERSQREFVANASHELQTPLTGLSLLADTLVHAVHDDPARVEEFVKRLGVEVDRITKLTNELMSLSRVDSMSPSLSATTERVDLSELVCDLVEEARPQAAAKSISLDCDFDTPAIVDGDVMSLEAIASGLIENAVRYTHEGGRIRMSTAPHTDETGAHWATLTVSDNGIGIAPEDQERIFGRFYRVDKARSRETGGHGLGLSIVRHAVEQHGGVIELTSELGVGSTFTVRLPAVS